jgi:hypothetical protein
MKLVDDPNATATRNGLASISSDTASAIAIGVMTMAIAVFEIKAERKNEKKYISDNMIMLFTSPPVVNKLPR